MSLLMVFEIVYVVMALLIGLLAIHIQLEENDLLIIEGLHGLNDELTSSINRRNKFKIFSEKNYEIERLMLSEWWSN